MSIGPERARLRQYLQGARHEATSNAGSNWEMSAQVLGLTADAMQEGMTKVREGNGTDEGLGGVTAVRILEAFQASAQSMKDKSVKISEAGVALRDTAEVVRKAEEAEAKMAVLEQPPAYTPPTYSPGAPATPEQIKKDGEDRAAANAKLDAYNTQKAEQESAAADWAQKMDAAFLAAIPPMQAIHGQPDPTEPPPSTPTTPTTPSTPGTPTTPGVPTEPTPPDGGNNGNDDGKDDDGKDTDKPPPPRPPEWPPPPPPPPEWPPPPPPPPPWPPVDPTPVPDPSPTPGPTTTVTGTTQSGITFNPSGGSVPAPTPSVGAPSAGASAAALGAAGGAGGLAAGAIRPGAVPTSATRGATPVRPIGSTARAGGSSALSRSAGSAGSAGRAGSAGSASRGAGSAGGRSAGSAAGRGAGKAGAGSRSAGSSGSRSGARGSAGSASGRGGRKGEDEKTNERDSLVYDQDWLGDDDVAPGVLD